MRSHFITALIQLFKIENNPVTIQALNKMTVHISESKYTDFLEECSKGKQFARPLEIIKSVANRYMDEIKSELFKSVESDSKAMERKLEKAFMIIEESFSPARGNKELIEKWKSPKNYINEAKINVNNWSKQEAYLIEKIGFSTLYGLYNDPYKPMWEAIAKEMRNAITKKYLIGDSKQIESKSDTLDNLQIKRIGK